MARSLDGGVVLSAFECVVLERFVHVAEEAQTIEAITLCCSLDPGGNHSTAELPSLLASDDLVLVFGDGTLLGCSRALESEAKRLSNLIGKVDFVANTPSKTEVMHYATNLGIIDLSMRSSLATGVVSQLAVAGGWGDAIPRTIPPGFTQDTIHRLRRLGYLVPRIRELKWGDLDQTSPICRDYGYSRGKPVDRYYLDQFITQIRENVRGETLEVGGRSANKEFYRFSRCESYRTMDLSTESGAELAADVHKSRAWKRSQFDTILAFNVLEHCARPWLVVENIHRWLRRGGMFYGIVPLAQRVHRDPRDYWRFMPDALNMMLEVFERVEIKTLGNVKACIASLAGIAAEELSAEELNRVDPNFPVVACISAEK